MRLLVKSLLVAAFLPAAVKTLAVPASELKETYQPIVDRNPFGLRPPPPPPTNNPTATVKEKPKTEMFLTGITAFGNPRVKKAYLMIKETAGKKEPSYYALGEGIEKDGIKVLSIDDAARKVRIHTEDGEQLLSFQTHGVQPPAAPAAAGKPGVPGQPGFPVPQPGNVAQPQPIAPGTLPVGVSSPSVNSGARMTTPATTRQIPTRRVRAGTDGAFYNPGAGGGVTPGANTGVPQPEVDPAEQYLRMHLNKAAQERETGVQLPPLPMVGQ